MTVEINGKRVRVEANASTLIIYEDSFKGRRLLRDTAALLQMTDLTDIPYGLVARLLWAEVRTADGGAPDFEEWLSGISVADILAARLTVLEVLAKSIATSKKSKAAAVRARIRERFSSLRTRRSAD